MRTLTPIIAGYAATFLMTFGVHISNEKVSAAIAPAISALYYVVVRSLEKYFPQVGWFLSHPAAPKYASVVQAPVVEQTGDIESAIEKVIAEVEAEVKAVEKKVATATKAAAKKATTATKKAAPKKKSTN